MSNSNRSKQLKPNHSSSNEALGDCFYRFHAPIKNLTNPLPNMEFSRVRLEGIGADLLLPLPPEPSIIKSALDQYWKAYAKEMDEDIVNDKPFRDLPQRKIVSIQKVECSNNDTLVAIGLTWPTQMSPGRYDSLFDKIRSLDCTPVLLLPMIDLLIEPQKRARGLASVARQLNGYIGLGGHSVDPLLYDKPSTPWDEHRFRQDCCECDLYISFVLQKRGFAGLICHSHQAWNVAFGGTIFQDIYDSEITAFSHEQDRYNIPENKPFKLYNEEGIEVFSHRVSFEPDSRLSAIAKCSSLDTNAFHHQSIDRVGAGLKQTGYIFDKITKKYANEANEGSNFWSVQFHPEYMISKDANNPFDRLIETIPLRALLLKHVWKKVDSGILPDMESVLRWMSSSKHPFRKCDKDWVCNDLLPTLREIGDRGTRNLPLCPKN